MGMYRTGMKSTGMYHSHTGGGGGDTHTHNEEILDPTCFFEGALASSPEGGQNNTDTRI
jgi:hypothetical protein